MRSSKRNKIFFPIDLLETHNHSNNVMPGINTGTRSSDPWQQLYDSENARRTSARKIHSLLDGEVLKPQKALKQNTSRTSEGLQKAGRRKAQPSQQGADYDAYDDENHEKVRLLLASVNISSSSPSERVASSGTFFR